MVAAATSSASALPINVHPLPLFVAVRPAMAVGFLHAHACLPNPVPSMCRACTSGYDLPIRVAIGRHVETLGGKVTDNMTRRNTHLILPFATGG